MDNTGRIPLFKHIMSELNNRFVPGVNLIPSGSMGESDGREFRPAASLAYAFALLDEEAQESTDRAISIISAVLDSQESDPRSPHYGNFTWLSDDREVTDLNAVYFVLRGLLPILLEHNDRLDGSLVLRLRKAVELALDEVERLNVSLLYTNIHLMSLFSLLAGSQWLKNSHYAALGRKRWNIFLSFTAASGAPNEYNSANYCAVDLSTLAALADLITDKSIKLQAELIYERLWIHAVTHIHYPTAQLAGPHCRSYWKPMTSGYSMLGDLIWCLTGWDDFVPLSSHNLPEMEILHALEILLTKHKPPVYLFEWLKASAASMPYEVMEKANPAHGDDLTTYFTRNYALGTSSRTYQIGTDCYYIEHQANYMFLHYARPHEEKQWGAVYSRFVINDRHWNTISAASDRPSDVNFYEQGNFAGAQLENKAICLYSLLPQHEEVFSIKTLIVFTEGRKLGRIMAGDSEITWDRLPCSPPIDDWIVVNDGNVLIGIKVLEPTILGPGADIRLEEGTSGELWISIENFRGRPRRLWEYASLKGPFWKGNIKAGYIIEVAESDEYDSTEDFLQTLRKSEIRDTVNEKQIRSVSFKRGDSSLQLNYDLLNNRAAGRWRRGRIFEPSELTSPLAVQGSTGKLQIGKATVITNAQPVWLIQRGPTIDEQAYIIVNPLNDPTPFSLTTPAGTVKSDNWGVGRIEWTIYPDSRAGIYIKGLKMPEKLSVPDNIKVYFNGTIQQREHTLPN